MAAREAAAKKAYAGTLCINVNVYSDRVLAEMCKFPGCAWDISRVTHFFVKKTLGSYST